MSTATMPKLPKYGAPAPERVCQTPEQKERYAELAQRTHAKYQPVSESEATLVNEIVIATWLMHHWKRQCGAARRAFRNLRKEEPESPRLPELEAHWRFCEWHAGKQMLFTARRKKVLEALRSEYEEILRQENLSIEDARRVFLGEEAEAPALAIAA